MLVLICTFRKVDPLAATMSITAKGNRLWHQWKNFFKIRYSKLALNEVSPENSADLV